MKKWQLLKIKFKKNNLLIFSGLRQGLNSHNKYKKLNNLIFTQLTDDFFNQNHRICFF